MVMNISATSGVSITVSIQSTSTNTPDITSRNLVADVRGSELPEQVTLTSEIKKKQISPNSIGNQLFNTKIPRGLIILI